MIVESIGTRFGHHRGEGQAFLQGLLSEVYEFDVKSTNASSLTLARRSSSSFFVKRGVPDGMEIVSHISQHAKLGEGSMGCCGAKTSETRIGALTGGKLIGIRGTALDLETVPT